MTYIFKGIQPWLCNKSTKIWHILSYPLYNIYTSGLIFSIFGSSDLYHERMCPAQQPLTFTNTSRSSLYTIHQHKNKTLFHKISPHDFFSCLSFQSVLVIIWDGDEITHQSIDKESWAVFFKWCGHHFTITVSISADYGHHICVYGHHMCDYGHPVFWIMLIR